MSFSENYRKWVNRLWEKKIKDMVPYGVDVKCKKPFKYHSWKRIGWFNPTTNSYFKFCSRCKAKKECT